MSRTLSSASFTHFENPTDPRIERTRAHELLDIMTIALCAAICGANTWTDVERFGLVLLTPFPEPGLLDFSGTV
jgi:hypothetical protein